MRLRCALRIFSGAASTGAPVGLLMAVAVALLVAMRSAAAPPAPIVHYPFDEASGPTRNDVAGPINTSAIEDGTGHLYNQQPIPAGPYGSLVLSGQPFGPTGGLSAATGEWLTAPSNELGPIVNDFTVMAWARPDAVSGLQRIYSRTGFMPPDGWGWGMTGNELLLTGFAIVDLGSSGAGLQAGVWQHVAVTKSSVDGVRFYVNGNLVTHRPAQTGDFFASAGTWSVLGIGDTIFPQFMVGLADEIRVYDAVLSESQIREVAAAVPMLLDAALVAGGAPELENAGGTLRLVEPELDSVGRPVLVPEPGFLWQLGPGLALLGILHRRRRSGGVPDPNRILPDAASRRKPS